MKTSSGTTELIEKERIRLQINAQVEEFLRRGGAIEVVTGNRSPGMSMEGIAWDDQDELDSLSD
jgi:hypothetical protein